ncbi:MAG: amidophosphoribosyltransferase [Sulfolobales archaeon]
MCGIAAFYGPNASLITYKLLIELQHRGQESAGISVFSGARIRTIVRPGYVVPAISLREVYELNSNLAVGHVRYSTTGGYMSQSGAQPVVVGDGRKQISLAFNGNIINYHELSKEFLGTDSSSDSEVLAKLVFEFTKEVGDVVEAVKNVSTLVKGSYSLVVMTSEPRLVIARDPHGFKPLAYSAYDDFIAVASETAPLESLGMDMWEEVVPGSIISYDGKSLEKTHIPVRVETFTPCVFEYVYFSRPDSIFNGVQIHEARVRMGAYLGSLDSEEVDVVIPVPDSGRSAALGYSMSRKVVIDEGLMRNRYVGRSFIMPPSMRELFADIKYGVVKSVIRSKKVAVIDDSLIRGTTMGRIVRLLRNRGAERVHVRIASPPVRYPCFMGIDFPTKRELIASRLCDVKLIAEVIGADSLLYNTVEGLRWSIGIPSLCLACYTGIYPFADIDIPYLEKTFSRG